ncbi:hypothetical protein [Candidatus Accumulibacter sp. ACC003]|uniref:hypothetical protein n=1 Tax=Candidatus Accumulibacter sp. ACC003 TaxID=2823334 RepID=UPI0025C01A26|nr:hypothetical protein [Candidatus Accumulibacter sp. ACC003]
MLDQLPAISVVTRIEVLGYPRLRLDEEILLLSSFDEYPIGARTAELAIALRQQRKLSL